MGCCKLKKIYALCENFIYTGQRPVPPDQHLSLRLASRWASMILPGSALALLAGHALRWVGMGSGESAHSRLSELSFMTLIRSGCRIRYISKPRSDSTDRYYYLTRSEISLYYKNYNLTRSKTEKRSVDLRLVFSWSPIWLDQWTSLVDLDA